MSVPDNDDTGGDGPDPDTASEPIGGDIRTSSIAFCVAAFVVLGAGFIFTFFFAGQLAGGGQGGGTVGNLFGSLGVSAGLGLVFVLSPLLALYLGTEIGHDAASNAVLNAALGTALGFLVTFFVTLALAASLSTQGIGSVAGAGPLLGFTVGIGLIGAGGAAIGQSELSVFDSVVDGAYGRPILFGVGTYLVFAVGYAVAIFLAALIAPGEGSTGLGVLGQNSVIGALGIGVVTSPLISLFIGLAVDRFDIDDVRVAALSSSIAAGLGFVVLLVVAYLIVLVLEPGGVTAGEFPLNPLAGFVVGSGLTAGSAAYLVGRA